ncbi:PD-(D/E)XK nuclease-like domain-containing protein [Prosthecobacter sp. SYSU 5D2]|uniref:PD-(D/E)XK nuclease-like domain-containing protein n=1 Tax=Prosthecobacter sp. SYSU 5D2 TaxID=3134134 RepID=UPI0031FF3B69
MNWEGFTDSTLAIPGTPIPGLWGYRRMSAEEYHAFPAVNASLLKRRTPAEMFAQLTAPHKDTDALTLGTLVHMVTLEPEVSWSDRFALADIPINKKTGAPYGTDTKKAAAAWELAKKENPGKIIVTEDSLRSHMEECRDLRDALLANPDAMQELEGAQFEVSGILWHEEWGCWIKWRLDILPRGGRRLGDVKTSSRHPMEFSRDCWQYGYFIQAVWYAHCHETLLARHRMQVEVTKFSFVIMSKADDKKQPRPPMVRVADLPLVPGIHNGVDKARQYLGIPQGLSRVDMFVSCAREYIEAGKPTDFASIRRCFPAFEQEAGEKGGRYVLAD